MEASRTRYLKAMLLLLLVPPAAGAPLALVGRGWSAYGRGTEPPLYMRMAAL